MRKILNGVYIGINTSIWSHAGISLSDALKRIKELGFKYVDLLGAGHCNPYQFDKDTRALIGKIIEKYDLTISSMVMLPLLVGNIASSSPEVRDRCLEYVKMCIDLTKELGGKQVLMDAGEKEIYQPIDIAWEISKSFIVKCAEYALKKEIILTLELEPCVYSIVRDVPSMYKMLKEVNLPNVLANIDIGHLAITRESPEELEQLRGLIIHAHISDNDGYVHANDVIGTGVTLVKEYLEKIIDLGIEETALKYNVKSVVGIELGLMGQKIDDPDSQVIESLEFIKKKCPWLTLY